MSNRRSFTAAFKRNVILYAEATNNCAAQRHFHISEKMVRGWRSQREQIFTCNSQRRAFRGPARGRHDDLEKELCWYIESERQKGIRLTCDDIQVRARQLAMRDGIDRSTFSASRGWAQRFLRRNGLSLRRKPRSSSQCRAPESEVERIEFESLLFEGEGQQLTILEESGSSTPVIKVEPSEHVDMAADTASDILASIFGAEEEILPFGQERERMDFTMPGSPVFALKVEPPDNANEPASPMRTGEDGMEGSSSSSHDIEESILSFAEPYEEHVTGESEIHASTIKTELCKDANLRVVSLPGVLGAAVQKRSDCDGETIVPFGSEVQSAQLLPLSSESQVSATKIRPCRDGSGEHGKTHHVQQGDKPQPRRMRSSKVFRARTKPMPNVQCHLKERIFCCHICLKPFTSKSKLVVHLRVHKDELPFKCSICSKSFLERQQVRAHKKIHLGKKLLQCHLCPRTFSTEHLLLVHLQKTTVRHQYKCARCSVVCNTAGDLQMHVAEHTEQRGHHCEPCVESFVSVSDLAMHSSTHTGQLPFKCGWCHVALETENQLKIHMAAHMSKRPFECDLCPMAFKTSYNLERHKRTHTKERPIKPQEECEKTISDDCKVEHCKEAPSQKRVFKCSRCVTMFHDGRALLRHFKTHSNDDS